MSSQMPITGKKLKGKESNKDEKIIIYENEIQKHLTVWAYCIWIPLSYCAIYFPHLPSLVQQSTKASTHASMYISHDLSTDIVLHSFAYYHYLTVSTRAVIGQFSGPYSTVRPAKI